MVVASVLAVVAALSLAASVSYAFAPASVQTSTSTNTTTTSINTTTTTTIISTNTYTVPLSSGQPQLFQLKENGTTTINATTYWYVSFEPFALSSGLFDGGVIAFHGVTFTFTAPLIRTNITRFQLTVVNETFVGGSSGYLLPSVKITFGDGMSTFYNSQTIAMNGNSSAVITMDRPTSNPWFTEHAAPQAGVGYGPDNGQMTRMTLHVSTT